MALVLVLLLLLLHGAAGNVATCRAALLSGPYWLRLKDTGVGGLGLPDECTLTPGSVYCLLRIVVSIDPPVEVPWGVCAPANCSVADLATLLAPVGMTPGPLHGVHVSLNTSYCGLPTPRWSVGGALTTGALALLVALGLGVTVTSWVLDQRAQRVDQPDQQRLLVGLDINASSDHPQARPPRHVLLRAFDWRNAYAELAQPTPPPLRAFDGVRVVSIALIVLGHTATFPLNGFDNPLVLQDARMSGALSWFWTALATSLRGVDSFFFVSATLVAYLVSKRAARTGVAPVSLKGVVLMTTMRLLRLWPTLLLWLMVWWQVVPMLQSGPVSAVAEQRFGGACNSYWWANVLFINNFVPVAFVDACMGWGWYLAVDTQLTLVVAPLVMWLYWMLGKRGGGWTPWVRALLIAAPFVAASCAVRLWVNIALPQGGMLEMDYMDQVYGKPWARSPPFVLGLLVGSALATRQSQGPSTAVLSAAARVVLHVGMVVGLLVCIVPLYYLVVVKSVAQHDALQVVYTLLYPSVWGVTMALFTWAAVERVLLGQCFWEWTPFGPLGKLGLSVYLVHPIILATGLINTNRAPFYSFWALISQWTSCLVLAYAAAFGAYVAIESPFAALAKALLPSSKRD